MKSSSSNTPCAACKFQRRKCVQDCVFASCFPPENIEKFALVHGVFGASNIGKLLNSIPYPHRQDAVNSLAYEASARNQDPVHGCVGHIVTLQKKLALIQRNLEIARKELYNYIGPAAYQQFHPSYQLGCVQPHYYDQAMMMELDIQQRQQHMAIAAATMAREQEIMLSLEQQPQNGIRLDLGLISSLPVPEQVDNPFQMCHQQQQQQHEHQGYVEQYLELNQLMDGSE